MAKSNNTQTAVLAGTVTLFLGLFAFYFLVQLPSTDKVTKQTADITALEKQVQLLNAKVAEKQKETTGPSMKEVQAALPLWDNVEQLTLDLSQIKSQTNVTMSSIAYNVSDKAPAAQAADGTKKAAAYPNVREIKVTMSVLGTFQDVTAALTQLHNLPRLVTVDTVNYGNLPKDLTRKISVNVSFTAFFDPSYKAKVDKVDSPF
ncbi:type 4a pilus biogenesis protein PilO [Paenibacillus oryzisoli]|uniref:type 4a pilus biogenesis protein PilO n=1 Tax=Paenibacillus oryzisoli TaxID=1850517 RepID=UPI003D2758A1